jgi:hypothetical protein
MRTSDPFVSIMGGIASHAPNGSEIVAPSRMKSCRLDCAAPLYSGNTAAIDSDSHQNLGKTQKMKNTLFDFKTFFGRSASRLSARPLILRIPSSQPLVNVGRGRITFFGSVAARRRQCSVEQRPPTPTTITTRYMAAALLNSSAPHNRTDLSN